MGSCEYNFIKCMHLILALIKIPTEMFYNVFEMDTN